MFRIGADFHSGGEQGLVGAWRLPGGLTPAAFTQNCLRLIFEARQDHHTGMVMVLVLFCAALQANKVLIFLRYAARALRTPARYSPNPAPPATVSSDKTRKGASKILVVIGCLRVRFRRYCCGQQ
jgi:hypothetical protein